MRILLLLMVFVSTSVSAVCNSEDLIGYWDYYQESESTAMQCSLRINGSGVISTHRFGCKVGGFQTVAPTTVTGTASIDSYCHVTAEMNVDGIQAQTIQATLNRSRDTIQGIGEDETGWAGAFTMVKFY